MAKTMTFYPFAYALYDEELKNHCWYCLKKQNEQIPVKKCSQCKVAVYCEKKCQSLGWFDHKPECRAIIDSGEFRFTMNFH